MQCMNWSFSWTDSTDSQLIRDYFLRFLYQPRDREYPDLCQLPDLTEQTLLENLKVRTTFVLLQRLSLYLCFKTSNIFMVFSKLLLTGDY